MTNTKIFTYRTYAQDAFSLHEQLHKLTDYLLLHPTSVGPVLGECMILQTRIAAMMQHLEATLDDRQN